MAQGKRVAVPFGDDLTPPQRVTRMLQIIDDLLPLAGLSQAEFCREDLREEAAAYAAALGIEAPSRLPRRPFRDRLGGTRGVPRHVVPRQDRRAHPP